MISFYTWQIANEYRACFIDDVEGITNNNDVILVDSAEFGRGSSELEAMGNLCLDEVKRIEEAENKSLLDKLRFAACMSPMRRGEWVIMHMLYKIGTKHFIDDIDCWRLYDRGYANEYLRDWSLTPAGKEYYESYLGTEELE